METAVQIPRYGKRKTENLVRQEVRLCSGYLDDFGRYQVSVSLGQFPRAVDSKPKKQDIH